MTAESLDPPALPRKLAAEVLGTFVLVLFGCGAAMASGADIAATSLAFGISVLVMAFAVGHISGGHFNPAVSVGAGVAGRIAWIDVAFYIVAQLVGAILAGLVLFTVWKGTDGFDSDGGMATNGWGDQSATDIALWAALLIEVIGTAVFLWVILAATDKRNKAIASSAPFAIGFALTGLHMVMIPLTGTSVNPARSIGVAIFGGTDAITQVWAFIVAPLVGAAIAGITYAFIFGRDGMEVVGGGLTFGGGNTAQGGGQWGGQQPVWDPNTGQWVTPQQQGAPQQWAQPAHEQQQWAQPQQEQQQWAPAPPAQEQQWAPAPPAQEQQWAQPQAPQAPEQQWAPPADGTQIRPNDPQQ